MELSPELWGDEEELAMIDDEDLLEMIREDMTDLIDTGETTIRRT